MSLPSACGDGKCKIKTTLNTAWPDLVRSADAMNMELTDLRVLDANDQPAFDEGVCWAIPESCAGSGSERLPLVELCESPGKCINVCDAIRSERPHRIADAPSCP